MERTLLSVLRDSSPRKGRRYLAMLLSLLMVATMSTSAMAADDDGGPDDTAAAGSGPDDGASGGSDSSGGSSESNTKPAAKPAATESKPSGSTSTTSGSASPTTTSTAAPTIQLTPTRVDKSTIKYMSKDEDDVLFHALGDEMARSVERLKSGAYGLPYFVQYKILDTDMYYMTASYGAISSESRSKSRNLYTDIRVGSYELDSSSGGGGFSSLFGGGYSGGSKSLPLEDDYYSLRHEIWLDSDATYKKAIEGYEAKKAKLKARPESERLSEMTREQPVVFIKPRVELKVDSQRWEKYARDLSAIFLKYPEFDSSVVHFSTQSGNAWLINNEGFKHRDGRTQTMMSVLAKIRSDDGRSYSDVEFVACEDPSAMPEYKELEKRVYKLIDRLKKVAAAPLAKQYSGPMLFEPEASASLMYQTLSRTLGGAQEDSGRSLFGNDAPLKDKLGQRVAKRILNVTDDPTATEFNGTKLLGGYEVDDDGVPGQKISLIENGVLKTYCTSRTPTRGVDKSNGHSGNGSGTVSILFVSGNPTMSPKQLKKKLIELGKEQGYEHVYIAREMARIPPYLLSFGSFSSILSSFGGDLNLYPTEIYRVDVKSGKEELVRGANVKVTPARALKDIAAIGSKQEAVTLAQGPVTANSIVVPSIIISEVDIVEPSKETDKPPVLPSPLAVKEVEGQTTTEAK